MGDYQRSTRACTLATLTPALAEAIRAHVERYQLGDLGGPGVACWETVSTKKKKGLFGGKPEVILTGIVLAPPVLGVRLLAAEQHPAVVATPHHPAARGIERVARFLDPGKDDPRVFLDQSRANMVAVCAWQASFPQPIEARYPFAASLMKGVPPPWLRKCPADAGSGLQLYGYGDAPCPTPPGTAR